MMRGQERRGPGGGERWVVERARLKETDAGAVKIDE